MRGGVHVTQRAGYSMPSILLHWVTLALLAGVYGSIEVREAFPSGSEARDAVKAWHFVLGLSVFALVGLRLLARLLFPPGRHNPPLPRWQAAGARLLHFALYGFMLVMPLLGWLLLNAEGGQASIAGLDLPVLVGRDEAMAETLEEVHEALGSAGFILIAIHATAALFHHYVLKDGTLARMMPKGA